MTLRSIVIGVVVVLLAAPPIGAQDPTGAIEGVVADKTAATVAGAIGPMIMGKAFDATGSYEALLVTLAIGTFSVGALMLRIPAYESRSVLQPAPVTPAASSAR